MLPVGSLLTYRAQNWTYPKFCSRVSVAISGTRVKRMGYGSDKNRFGSTLKQSHPLSIYESKQSCPTMYEASILIWKLRWMELELWIWRDIVVVGAGIRDVEPYSKLRWVGVASIGNDEALAMSSRGWRGSGMVEDAQRVKGSSAWRGWSASGKRRRGFGSEASSTISRVVVGISSNRTPP